MSDFKKELIEAQKHIVDAYEQALEDAPYEHKRLAQEILHMQRTILHRTMGYRKPVEALAKKPPPKGFFKNKLTEGEQPIKAIDNKNIAKNVFSKKEVPLDVVPKGVKNENVNKDALKPNKVVDNPNPKANPKRLNPKQTNVIKDLAKEGLNAVQISDKLWIVKSKVVGVLEKLNKGGNLIATNMDKEPFSKK